MNLIEFAIQQLMLKKEENDIVMTAHNKIYENISI